MSAGYLQRVLEMRIKPYAGPSSDFANRNEQGELLPGGSVCTAKCIFYDIWTRARASIYRQENLLKTNLAMKPRGSR